MFMFYAGFLRVPGTIDPPLASMPAPTNVREFLGEDTLSIGTPPTMSRKPSGSRPQSTFGSAPDPSIWSEEQQQQLMNALMGNLGAPPSMPGLPPAQVSANDNPAMPDDNPLAALMAMLPQQGGQGSAGAPPGMIPSNLFGQPPAPVQPTKKIFLQKIMPLIHLLAGWILLSYFVLWKEPQVYELQPHAASTFDSIWNRWAELGWKKPQDNWGVQFVVRRALSYMNPFLIKPYDSPCSGLSQLLPSCCIHGGYSEAWYAHISLFHRPLTKMLGRILSSHPCSSPSPFRISHPHCHL